MKKTFLLLSAAQICIAGVVIAVPLFAYANIEADAKSFGQPAFAAPSAPIASIDPQPKTISCNQQHWPNYSAECVRGPQNPVRFRTIALVSNDVPLSSLPRIVDVPATSLHVVTTDVQPHLKRSASRRAVARVMPRREMSRNDLSSLPTTASASGTPAGW